MTKSSKVALARGKSNSQYVTKKAVRDMFEAQVERKIQIGTLNTTASIAGFMTYFSSIAQDDTISGRTGDKIILKEVDWTFSYSDTVLSVCRFMLVLDRFNQGVAPTVTDVLSSATVQAHLQAVNRLQNRFKVLADVTLDIAPGSRQYITKRGTVKLNVPTFFNGTTAAVALLGRMQCSCCVLVLKQLAALLLMSHKLTLTRNVSPTLSASR